MTASEQKADVTAHSIVEMLLANDAREVRLVCESEDLTSLGVSGRSLVSYAVRWKWDGLEYGHLSESAWVWEHDQLQTRLNTLAEAVKVEIEDRKERLSR